MTDIKLFSLDDAGVTREIPETPKVLEKFLQQRIEQNIEMLLGVRLLGTEYSTGRKHGGRVDTLGIDKSSRPVIIEYKRATNENVINQGLFYLDWLLDHQAEFKQLVQDKLGAAAAGAIDWSAPRLICVAGGFTRYDERAVQQMKRNIELIRYRRFCGDLLMLELVTAIGAESGPFSGGTAKGNETGLGDLVAGFKASSRPARLYKLLMDGKVRTIEECRERVGPDKRGYFGQVRLRKRGKETGDFELVSEKGQIQLVFPEGSKPTTEKSVTGGKSGQQ